MAARGGRAAAGEDVYRVGVLNPGPDAITQAWEAFEQGLREEGFVEGRNLSFEQGSQRATSSACPLWQLNLSG